MDKSLNNVVQNKKLTLYKWNKYLITLKEGCRLGSSRKNFLTSDPLGVILCEKAIARIPEI